MMNITSIENAAVDAAVSADWKRAIELNLQILDTVPDDFNAHMRLAFAYLQSSKLKESAYMYRKALKIQPKNIIALEQLEKIQVLSTKKSPKIMHPVKYDPDLFIELPGKTKSVALVNLGKKEDLAACSIGQECVLKEKKRRLEVRTVDEEYIGTLPDDISKRLIYFIQEKSKYAIHIKEVSLTSVILFIRELSKGQKVRQYPSFPSNPHVMLTDIQHLEDEQEEDGAAHDDEEHTEEDADAETHEEATAWEDDEEEKEESDLDTLIQVEDDEEEEEE